MKIDKFALVFLYLKQPASSGLVFVSSCLTKIEHLFSVTSLTEPSVRNFIKENQPLAGEFMQLCDWCMETKTN